MRSKHNYNFCDLNLVLVVYTKMSVHFVLSTLESDVTMGTSATVQTSSIPSLTVDATAVFHVSLDDMKAVFKFETDSYDFTDLESTDIKYYVDSGAFPLLNPANAMMDAAESLGAIATANIDANKQMVAHDFVRYLAVKLFNTHHGVDLFNNEVNLLKNLREICSDAAEGNTWFDVKAKLAKVGLSGDHADITGTDGSKYMTNSNSTDENICRVLLEQMTNSAISRFSDIAASDAPQSLPFRVDDSISFKLTIHAADGQEELTGVAPLDPRSYEIKFVIVDGTATNTEVAADEL